MGQVFRKIAGRLHGFSIDIEKYIYHFVNNGKRISTLQEGPTTLEGIKFIAQNEGGKLGIKDLRNALNRAQKGGKRAFAGQISTADLNNALLQASFAQTEGLGFREIFYLSRRPMPCRDPRVANVMDSDGRAFDAKFGEMLDAVDVSSLHAALLEPVEPVNRTALLAALAREGHKSNIVKKNVSSIHIDEKGFVFADSDGRIFISSTAIQHTGDELGIKDKLLDGTSPLSFFFHTDLNSISDPAFGSREMQRSGFLRKRNPRGVLGLELSTKSKGLQIYLRGSMGISTDERLRPESPDFSAVVGLRKRFRIF